MKPSFTLSQWTLLIFAFINLHFSLSAKNYECNPDGEDDLFSIYCPEDVTVSCTDELWDLSIYGNATYHDYSGYHDAGNPTENWNLSSCNTGTITRTWTVEDYNWNLHSCSQTITVVGSSNAFSYNSITWPLSHLELEGCNPATHPSQLPAGYGWPTYPWVECSSIGVSYKDTEYIVDAGCRKIMRKWKVKDWCYSNYNSGWGSSNGEWTYTQVIKILGGEEPVINCQDTIYQNSYDCNGAYVSVPPIAVSGDTCGGYYQIENTSPYADNNGSDISGTYPIGTTKVKYTVDYGCFNRKTCTTYVVVKDKKGPNLYCRGDLTTALMPVDVDGDGIPEDGMIDIWAKDLDAGSTPSCNGYSLKFSFSEDPNDDVRIFTCEDVGENDVRMYATDNYGRQNYCIVKVSIQNNGANIPDCEPEEENIEGDSSFHKMYSIGGLVFDAEESLMANTQISLTNTVPILNIVELTDTIITETIDTFYNSTGAMLWFSSFDTTYTYTIDSTETYMETSTFSGENGKYMFSEIADSTDVLTLAANYINTEESDKIDQLDLNHLLQYLLGQIQFERLEQYVAADINSDKKIDFEDLKLMLKHVTEESVQELAYDWTVIPYIENTDVNISLEELSYTMTMAVNNEDHLEANWKAIKIGDIVQTAPVETTNAPTFSELVALKNSSISSIEELKSVVADLDLLPVITKDVIASPNPFTNKVQLDYMDSMTGKCIVQFFDNTGKILYKNVLYTKQGNNIIEVDLTKTNYQGVLFYQIIDGTNIYNGKMLKI